MAAAVASAIAVDPAPAAHAEEPPAEFAAAVAANAQRVANLSADLILGRARVVILAGLDSVADADQLAGKLIGDSLHRGLSVARVDAGSGRPSTEPGITDLAAEAASFGDVVHRTAQEGLAEVPWGHFSTLLRQSSKPATLVEALSDLYEVVMVNAGCVDADSSLPAFAGLAVRLILVTPPGADPARVEAAWEQVAALGFDQIEVLAAPIAQAEVA
jgi:Mrp family chromosome partitioning ATPase